LVITVSLACVEIITKVPLCKDGGNCWIAVQKHDP
jgi:hypothetical protein